MASRSRTLIAMFSAVVYALTGLRLFLSSLASLIAYKPPPDLVGSGGLGAVTTAIDVLVVPFFLLALASIVCNRMMAAWAKRSGATARTIHHGHTLTAILAFGLPVIATLTFQERAGTVSLLFILSGLALGAHFLLAAALLGLYGFRLAPRP